MEGIGSDKEDRMELEGEEGGSSEEDSGSGSDNDTPDDGEDTGDMTSQVFYAHGTHCRAI